MSSQVENALAHWREQLGPRGVVTAPAVLAALVRNTSNFRPRAVVAALRPETPEQVAALVCIAREHRVPLYPFSTGKNWGLGSKLPPTDGCALVDLGALNRIREVDERRHYAIIEPGVTQRQLSEELARRGLKLLLNVTGSSPESSLVGNVMERGTGFTLHRAEELRGVEVVLGTGERLRTGYWSDQAPSRPAHHYKYGIGPYLDGLFTQANYGIVTAIVLNLVPRPEDLRMFLFSYEHAAVPRVIETLSTLFKDGVLRWMVHMFNDKRMKTVNNHRQDTPRWTGIGSIGGSPASVRFVSDQLQALLGPLCTGLHVFSEQDADAPGFDPVVRGMVRLHLGRPTTTFMHGLYNTLGTTMARENLDDLDSTRYGMLACLPLYPMDGGQVVEALRIVDDTCAPFGLVPAVTLNPMDADGLESVMNLYFDRRDAAEAQRAQRCNEQLHLNLMKAEFRFYRVDIENMRHVVSEDSPYWRTVRSLKAALDPANIIAPRRYNPL